MNTQTNQQYYREVQRFRAWEAEALLLFLIAGLSWRLISSFMSDIPGNAASPLEISLMLVFTGAFMLYLVMTKVSVELTESEIRLRTSPWQVREVRIPWSQVSEIEMVQTPLLSQLNGWNISFDHSHNYTTCGRNGLHVTTKDGEQYFVGSRTPQQLAHAAELIVDKARQSNS